MCVYIYILVGGLEHLYFPIYLEQSSQFTNMFQKELKPPTRYIDYP